MEKQLCVFFREAHDIYAGQIKIIQKFKFDNTNENEMKEKAFNKLVFTIK